jgi:hypothetical protein
MTETVYIPNKTDQDFSAAEKYGELCFLTDGIVRRYDVPTLYRQIADKMRESQAHDYIVVSNLPILNVISCAIQMKRHGRANVLLYRGGEYLERTVQVT